MSDTPYGRLRTVFVASRVKAGYGLAAEAAESLVGRQIQVGSVRLRITDASEPEVAGTRLTGVLKLGSLVPRSVPVEVVITPWSADQTEVGIRPLGRLGDFESMRTRRVLDGAWAVLAPLTDAVTAEDAVTDDTFGTLVAQAA